MSFAFTPSFMLAALGLFVRGPAQQIGDLRSLLSMPAHGRFEIQNQTRWVSIPRAPREASAAKVRDELARRRAATGEWFPEETAAANWTPIAIARSGNPGMLFSTTHRLLAFDSEHLKFTTHWDVLEPTPRRFFTDQTLVREGEEVIAASASDTSTTPTIRRPRQKDEACVIGSGMDLVRGYLQFLFVAELARSQGALISAPDRVTFEIPGEPLRKIHELDFFAPVGSYQIVDRVLGSLRATEHTTTLKLEWFDVLGGLFDRTTIEWGSDKAMPSSWLHETFVPGTDLILYRSEDRCRRISDEPVTLAEVLWNPRAGERVEDSRHGAVVDYTIDAQGARPREAGVIVRAVAAGTDERRFVAVAIKPDTPAESDVAGGSPMLARLACARPTVELGAQPLASRHGVSFTLVNTNSRLARLGRVEADCGCIDPRLASTEVEAGESTTLHVTQQVQSVGHARHRIAVHWRDDDGVAAEVFVELEGTPRLLVFPESVELGRLRESDAVRLQLVAPDQACAKANPPLAEAEGYSVQAHWTHEAATGAWHGELELSPSNPLAFGAQEVSLKLRADADEEHVASVRALFERVPASHADAWPDCTVAISDKVGLTHVWCFPAEFEPLGFDENTRLSTQGVSFALAPAAHQLATTCVILTAEARARAPNVARVRLRTNGGDVALQLVFVP